MCCMEVRAEREDNSTQRDSQSTQVDSQAQPEGLVGNVSSPASRAQIVGITVTAVLSAAGGLIAFTAAELGGVARTEVWISFAVCEGLALCVGG